jgi:hypothetical protein
MAKPRLKIVAKFQRCATKERSFKKESTAAVLIQRHFRGHLARREAGAVHATLLQMQARHRGWVARRNIERQRNAALLVQRAVRRFQAQAVLNALAADERSRVSDAAYRLAQEEARAQDDPLPPGHMPPEMPELTGSRKTAFQVVFDGASAGDDMQRLEAGLAQLGWPDATNPQGERTVA